MPYSGKRNRQLLDRIDPVTVRASGGRGHEIAPAIDAICPTPVVGFEVGDLGLERGDLDRLAFGDSALAVVRETAFDDAFQECPAPDASAGPAGSG